MRTAHRPGRKGLWAARRFAAEELGVTPMARRGLYKPGKGIVKFLINRRLLPVFAPSLGFYCGAGGYARPAGAFCQKQLVKML